MYIAPPPSGPINRRLQTTYLQNAKSRWFRSKLAAYLFVVSKGKRSSIAPQIEAFDQAVEAAEYRQYANFNEARRSIGYAGTPGGTLVLGMVKWMEYVPIFGAGSFQHELIHVAQQIHGQWLDKEQDQQVSLPQRFRMEMAAFVFGNPSLSILAVGVFCIAYLGLPFIIH